VLLSIVVSSGIKRVLTAFNSLQMIASKNQPVKWTSPVGLPVVQPYKKYKNYTVCFLSMTADVFVALSFFFLFILFVALKSIICALAYSSTLHVMNPSL
jgi:hypothetical protein